MRLELTRYSMYNFMRHRGRSRVFLRKRGAPLKDDVTDGQHKQILKVNNGEEGL